MRRSVLAGAALACISGAAAFAPAAFPTGLSRQSCRAGMSDLHMGKSFEQKVEIVSGLKDRLASTQLMFATEAKGMTMPQIKDLRNSLPEGSTLIMVKNRLLKRAIAGGDFAPAEQLAKESTNMWILIDEDIKGSITAFKDWKKTLKKETGMVGGVIEGNLYGEKQLEAIGDLPSKSDLYAQIAGSIQAVPAVLAGTIKEAGGQKASRAIRLAFAPDA